MSTLDRLKETIETWKKRLQDLEAENQELREQLEHANEGVYTDEALLTELAECQNTVAMLQEDIAEKDKEIEAIIAKVETLIDA